MEIKIDKQTIEEVIKYIEKMEDIVEHEFGSLRTLEEMIEDGDIPEIYFKMKKLLNSIQ